MAQTIESLMRATDTPRPSLTGFDTRMFEMVQPTALGLEGIAPVSSDVIPPPPPMGPVGAPDPDLIWRWIMLNWGQIGGMYDQLYQLYADWITGDPSRMDQIWYWIKDDPSKLQQLWDWYSEWGIEGALIVDGGYY